MNSKTGAIIATVATVLCCGLPGCLSVCAGLLFALAGVAPGSGIDTGNPDPASNIGTGLLMLCTGVIFVIIPVATGFFSLRGRPQEIPANFDNSPLPPAS